MLFLVVLLSGLLQLVSHLATKLYAPRMPVIPRYVIGTLCLLIPPTMFYGLVDALPFWACAVASGVAVIGATKAGEWIEHYRDLQSEHEIAKVLPGAAGKILERMRDAQADEEDR